jgi:hypothetical protein
MSADDRRPSEDILVGGRDRHGLGELPDAPGNAGIAPRDTTIAAFGDSLMWGQGVARHERFSLLTAQGIRKLVPNPTDGPMLDRSRSGAQIKVRDGSDREDFADTYPSLLPTDTAVDAFLQGDESAAQKLFGEVPCSFPTVIWQVRSLSDDFGGKIKVALLSGGANDINFEAILDPTENQDTFVDKFAGDIREICHKDTLDLLREARPKMPNAVILLFGYFPPFSYETDREELKKYFRHELDSNVKWYLNAVGDFWNISGSVDVDKATAEARVRSVWAHGLATYWQRKTVTDANRDDAIRGPGVVFVPCGFKPDNSAFTREPMVHGDYTHPASDAMQAERVKHIPRVDALQHLEGFLQWLKLTGDNFEGAKALREKIDGPTSLEEALYTRERARGRTPAELLTREIYRIHRALIASFVHPNREGDQQYANMAVRRYAAHRLATDNLPHHGLPPLPSHPGGPESLQDRLSRFGLRGQGPLQADVGHEFIDAIRVTVSTSRSSDKGFAPDLYLQLVLIKAATASGWVVNLQLNMQYYTRELAGTPFVNKFYPQLEPNRKDEEFSIDVSGHTIRSEGQLLLKDLIGMRLVVGDWPQNQTWLPEDLSVDINGVQVLTRDLRGTRLGPRGNVDLKYPDPAPKVDTPVLAPTTVRIGPVPQ